MMLFCCFCKFFFKNKKNITEAKIRQIIFFPVLIFDSRSHYTEIHSCYSKNKRREKKAESGGERMLAI